MNSEEDIAPLNAAAAAHGRKLHLIGGGVTVVWLLGTVVYALCVWPLMLQMKPDGLATFLSGVFAPLAFLWLVLGFMQQGDELRHSSQALWLQGEELRNSVEQQRQLVEVSREQMASEAASRASADAEADRTAQPILTLTASVNGRSGDDRVGRMYLSSNGPDCIDVEIRISDGRKIERPVFEANSKIEIHLKYKHPDEIQPIELGVQYTDYRGNRRQQNFFVPAIFDRDFGKNFAMATRLSAPSPILEE